jgi:putative selenium metabolism hydrolase
MSETETTALDGRIAELAARDRSLAVEILAEAIRVPADHVDLPEEKGGDPLCGLSNHEGPRLEYLKRRIVEVGAVARAEDVFYDDFGNLVWEVRDEDDGVPDDERTVVWYDGHTDTVAALRPRWREATGGADCYDGLVDAAQLDRAFLRNELGWLPPDDEWEHLVFGRGSADQLGGVVCQIIATRILRELRGEGALRGITVRAYATVAEEDNDGGGPMHVLRHELRGAPRGRVPDAVILTEGTGDKEKGACGIYRGQRGRMQIEVEVTGRSCHGSMPWEGRNPLEWGGAILAEAAAAYRRGEGFGEDAFLGPGTRTASWAKLDTPSDCAVPERFTFRFDRRLTAGEDPQEAVAAVESLPAVAAARAEGLKVEVRVPRYEAPTWKGTTPGNPQIYPGWVTPEDHPVIRAAAAAYRRVASPRIPAGGAGGMLRDEPRVDRWIFSTDGVGMVVDAAESGIDHLDAKGWVRDGRFAHPPLFGIGPGIEQNTHKIGECVDSREIDVAVAVMARLPSLLRETKAQPEAGAGSGAAR